MKYTKKHQGRTSHHAQKIPLNSATTADIFNRKIPVLDHCKSGDLRSFELMSVAPVFLFS